MVYFGFDRSHVSALFYMEVVLVRIVLVVALCALYGRVCTILILRCCAEC